MKLSFVRFVVMLLTGTILAYRGPMSVALELSPGFSDHMVLQCDLPLHIAGRAEPGEKITVEFHALRVTTTADSTGHWVLELPRQKASSAPATLRVVGNSSLELRDVLVGEVWLCAGQSNMEWPLAREASARETVPTAHRSQLRLLDRRSATRNVSGTSFSRDQRARLTAQRFFDGTWRRCAPGTASEFSAIGYYFGRELQARLSVPVGIICVAVGGSPTEAWIRRDAMAADVELKPLVEGNWLENPKLGPWCKERGQQNLGPFVADTELPSDGLGPNHPFKPGFLWRAGIEPLLPLAVRGVLWYQGESNSLDQWRLEQHALLFPRLVADWREQFGQPKMPFLFCQLSSIGTAGGYQSEFWPEFRNQQRLLAQSIDHCGMVVTSDVGHPTDVHPRDKQTVANRLTRSALAIAHQQPGEYSGPLPVKAELSDGAVRVQFAHITGSLATSDLKPVASFEVSGADREFHPATAEIRDRSVLVHCESVAEPRFVRYGWQPFSLGNLTDSARLPASTFEITVPAAD